MSTINLLVRGQWLVQYMHGHVLIKENTRKDDKKQNEACKNLEQLI